MQLGRTPPLLTVPSLSDRLSHSPPTSSSLSHFYEGSMWDDSHLHAARSYTSSPDSPFSLRSSSTQSAHLFFGLPLLLLHCTSIAIALFPTYSSSYHRSLRSWTFSEISPTFVLRLIFSFLILSNLVTPHIHRCISTPPTVALYHRASPGR